MKNLIFAVIISVFYACNFSTEPETTTQQPNNTPKKITTLVFEYTRNKYTVLYSKSTPDTVFPAYSQQEVNYKKVDSIWGFYYSAQTDWLVRINDGLNSHWNCYGSAWQHKFIKKWEK
jgi:hypothetical protein